MRSYLEKKKEKLPDLSSLFATHRFDMLSPAVKFHEYIQYGLGVIDRTRFF